MLGYDPVAEARLPSYAELLDFFERLAAASPHARLDTIGRSTLDAPMVSLIVTDAANLVDLDRLRAAQEKLADPRRIASPSERAELLESAKLVAVVTAGTHSTEVGGPLATMRLAHRLATSPGMRETRIRREAIVLMIPAVNPDGIDHVKAWYDETTGTPWQGSDPPTAYHHYVGHDLNRDWYALTQRETRAVVSEILLPWAPHLHVDLHQQESNGARHFVPPWLDPTEPNVDPLLIAAASSLGTRTQWAMLEEGKTGVSVAARYDAWSPSRAFVHYHAGVRILTETASARLAAPIEVRPDDLAPVPGVDPRVSSWNHPIPWPGGRWDLGDVVDYMTSSVVSTLAIAASERSAWLGNFERIGRRAVDRWPSWPEAWLIPPPGETAVHFAIAGHAELLRTLAAAGVEVRRLSQPIVAEDRVFPAETRVVDMHQPYASFAQTMLAPQAYPDRRRYAGGPPLPPYDGTAHNLALLLGVDVFPSYETVPAGDVVPPPSPPPRRVTGVSGDPSVMVGLYRPWTGAPEEGWVRWLYDHYAVPYTTLTNADLISGSITRDLTAVVLPAVPYAVLHSGRSAADVPPEYAGGLDEPAVDNLRTFVSEGGTLVADGSSVDFVIDALELPVANITRNLAPTDFYAPGSIVGLAVDTSTAIGRGAAPEASAWFEDGAAFRLLDGESDRVRTVARFADEPVARSGWVIGGGWIAGRPAVVEIELGEGRVVLFGIRPQYRGQSMATWPLFLNALKRRP